MKGQRRGQFGSEGAEVPVALGGRLGRVPCPGRAALSASLSPSVLLPLSLSVSPFLCLLSHPLLSGLPLLRIEALSGSPLTFRTPPCLPPCPTHHSCSSIASERCLHSLCMLLALCAPASEPTAEVPTGLLNADPSPVYTCPLHYPVSLPGKTPLPALPFPAFLVDKIYT